MIIGKEIANCEAGVKTQFDTSKEGMRKALANNSLKLFCKKIDEHVALDTTALFGSPINLRCLKTECTFNKDRGEGQPTT